MDISKHAKAMSEDNGLSEEINQAYINLVGDEYADAEGCADAYQGTYSSDEDFAQSIAEDMGLTPDSNHWPNYCIDWEYAARELMMDYDESDGHYFHNL